MGDIVEDPEKFRRGWVGGLPETPCGSGSTLAATERQRRWIPQIVDRYGIRTIADIGAGDLNWMRRTPLPPGIDYRAFDLVPRAAGVQVFDITTTVPPRVDLLLCLWVVNHLPYLKAQAALRNLRASGSRYLIMTDRPRWHAEQPPEIHMPYLEALELETPGRDRLLLIELPPC